MATSFHWSTEQYLILICIGVKFSGKRAVCALSLVGGVFGFSGGAFDWGCVRIDCNVRVEVLRAVCLCHTFL
jgi:hypothetical protein